MGGIDGSCWRGASEHLGSQATESQSSIQLVRGTTAGRCAVGTRAIGTAAGCATTTATTTTATKQPKTMDESG